VDESVLGQSGASYGTTVSAILWTTIETRAGNSNKQVIYAKEAWYPHLADLYFCFFDDDMVVIGESLQTVFPLWPW
jgi:hypothetical protein